MSALKYRIEEKKGFRVVGVQKRFSKEEDWYLKEESDLVKGITEFWNELSRRGSAVIDIMINLLDSEPFACLGIDDTFNDEDYIYWIAVPSNQPCPPSFSEMVIPPSTWAIFEYNGQIDKALTELWRCINTEWLPGSGYERQKAPHLELYFITDPAWPNNKRELWIPVARKQSAIE
jgi:AraC family transcriptional regulator